MNHKTIWAFALTSAAAFMVTLDNLVVTTAIPVIRRDLDAGIGGLEWTVNAYTLTFAVLLLTGAALGDRFGRRRVFALGLLGFTAASAAAALALRRPLEELERLAEAAGDDRREELLLRAEEPEHVRLRDPGPPGDVLGRGAVEPARGELLERRVEDLLAALGLGLPGGGGRHDPRD